VQCSRIFLLSSLVSVIPTDLEKKNIRSMLQWLCEFSNYKTISVDLFPWIMAHMKMIVAIKRSLCPHTHWSRRRF